MYSIKYYNKYGQIVVYIENTNGEHVSIVLDKMWGWKRKLTKELRMKQLDNRNWDGVINFIKTYPDKPVWTGKGREPLF